MQYPLDATGMLVEEMQLNFKRAYHMIYSTPLLCSLKVARSIHGGAGVRYLSKRMRTVLQICSYNSNIHIVMRNKGKHALAYLVTTRNNL